MFKSQSISCETFTYPTNHTQAGVTSAGPCTNTHTHTQCVYHLFSIHLSVDGHLGFFHIWVITNNAATNIRECKSL